MNASVHHLTPILSVIGPRGEAVRQVEYLRTVAGEAVRALIRRLQYDVAGHPVAQRDPRLPTPNTTTVFRLDGLALKTHNVDSGENTVLPGPGGEFLQNWDANGNHREMTYDDQLRLLAVEENGTPDIETFTYADRSGDPAHNLRGQLIRQEDPSGSVEARSFALSGQVLREIRTFHDAKAFISSRRYSPLGAVLTQTDAGGHQQEFTHDVAGQLTRVQLQLNGQSGWRPVLKAAQYNAAGQILEQQAGNDVISRWQYRAADGRLHRHIVQKASEPPLQNFEYEYDRVGNITRILDHAYTPTYFRNQQVDGHQSFDYDTLYQLIRATGYADAPPSDNLGRPQPSDPANRRNYIEHYKYDDGGNLVETVHIRDGASHTTEMSIDPSSNRGVRWKRGDPLPDFTKLFDSAGNLQALQPGVPMQWNNRGELDRVIIVDRNGSSANDEEYYHYSQDERVYKRHDTHTTKVSHFHEVRYLPGLEIRTRENGEELHLIPLSLPSGSVVCLHWKAGKPSGIEADQLRYTYSDHLGSVSLELDQQARMVSDEGYLPFGGTAWMAARTLIEVNYRFIRYSGKEMDVTRLYYYGVRYYADWLGRWISADPAGDVDGLNRYAFVGNSPLRYFDSGGTEKTPSEQRQLVVQQIKFLSTAQQNLNDVKKQFGNLTSPSTFRLQILKNFVFLAGRAAAGFLSGYHTTGHTFQESSLPGELQGLTLGNFAADSAAEGYTLITAPLKLNTPILPRHSDLEPGSIMKQSAGISAGPLDDFITNPQTWQERSENIRTFFRFGRNTVGGAIWPGVSELSELMHVAKDATKAEQLLTEYELKTYESLLDSLEETIGSVADAAEAGFDAMGVEQFYARTWDLLIDIGLGKAGTADSRMVSRSDIKKIRGQALQSLGETRATITRYRQYAQQRTASKAA
ncbi:RHS repeat-associated core domain-containing protein [Pseudomonas sp. 91RF]|uniref:RHS repeat-associated core domain-containing protein n=1 Tax=Pseudomonas sp. 91RF TaxID=2292261 RepID=UPI000E65EC3F|nr:RHS repeat-associated core domain-containing protein [Pseudomonas sp. 91RF]RIJ10598.1 RHS repeat-associated core domain-containing protein [Pseudomonas sp. 91RF]